MKVTLDLLLDVQSFDTLEAKEAQRYAQESNGVVYSWKTIFHWNWLERGFSRVDVLALVVLPKGLPPYMDMADDSMEPGVEY